MINVRAYLAIPVLLRLTICQCIRGGVDLIEKHPNVAACVLTPFPRFS
jgi:hypothetical protein